jgi:hypothetical protein
MKTRITIITLLIISVVMIFISRLIKTNTTVPAPPSTPQPTMTSRYGDRTQPITVNYTGPDTSLPKELQHYMGDSPNSNLLSSQLAAKLNLSPHDLVKNLWINEDGSRGLSLDAANHVIQLTLAVLTSKTTPNIDKAVAVAETYLNAIGITEIQLLPEYAEYIDATGEYHSINEVFTIDNSVAVHIPFLHTINNTPLFLGTTNWEDTAIIVSGDYDIIKITLTPPLENITQTNIRPTKSLTDALKEIELGNFIYTHLALSGNPIPPSPNDPANLTLNQVQIEYRLNPTTASIDPYYSFSGSSNFQQNTIEVTLAVPATL